MALVAAAGVVALNVRVQHVVEVAGGQARTMGRHAEFVASDPLYDELAAILFLSAVE
ncbi:hypothetical protein [Kutzneria buriramensis]|uniref:hypothetical protein n=1 Tax=Kutzneria buriramensis TaxID=1045776 RepID=UPI001476A21D|nr:hypothetical protein [Kutzneria buriramensis]